MLERGIEDDLFNPHVRNVACLAAGCVMIAGRAWTVDKNGVWLETQYEEAKPNEQASKS